MLKYVGGVYTTVYNSSSASSATQTCGVGDVTNDGWPDFFDMYGGGFRVYSYNVSSSSYYSLWNETSRGGLASPLGGSSYGDSDNDGKGEFFARDVLAPWNMRLLENNTVNATSFSNTLNLTSGSSTASYVMIGDLDSNSLKPGDCNDNDASVYPGHGCP